MRLWPWLGLALFMAASPASACYWGGDMEGRWGLWSVEAGELEIVESPMFSHGTACEPYPPGHAVAGDLFVWAEPVWRKENLTRIHVRQGGYDVAIWPLRTQSWRDVAHLGVANGVAYLVWETRGNETARPIGRLDLADGAYTELADPFPNTDPFWERLGGSVLWTTWPRFADAEEGVWAFDLATGTELMRNVTGSSLGIAGHDVWPMHKTLGAGWAVYAVQDGPGLESKVSYRAYEFTTGRMVAFELPDHPFAAWAGGGAFYAWLNGTLYRVDLSQQAPMAAALEWPDVEGEEHWGPSDVASVSGDKVILAWFADANPDKPDEESGKNYGIPAPGMAALAALLGAGTFVRRRCT